MTSVLIVDDDALARQYIRGILTDEGFEVAGEVTDGDEALRAVTRFRPDIVLMDLEMKRVGGVEAIRRVGALPKAPPCLAVTTFEDEVMIKQALEAGAVGYLVKRDPPATWSNYIREALAGGRPFSPTAAARLVADYLASGTADPGAERVAEALATLEVLTDGEREVVALIQGRTNVEIGKHLYLSEHTVKTHVSRALTKLGLRRRTELTTLAVQAGINVPPNS